MITGTNLVTNVSYPFHFLIKSCITYYQTSKKECTLLIYSHNNNYVIVEKYILLMYTNYYNIIQYNKYYNIQAGCIYIV